MKEIDGVKLQDLIATVRAEVQKNREAAVLKAAHGLYHQVDSLTLDVEKAKEALQRAEQKLTAAKTKVAKLEAGDWGVLEAPKAKDTSEQS